MNVLIKSAEIFDPGSEHHGKRKNLLIENGIIRKISDTNHKADRIIEGMKLVVSPGWIDMRVATRDPGFEYKEDILSLAEAAAAGGFTEVVSLPNTKPVVQTKDVISYISGKASSTIIHIHPLAAVTVDNKGEEMTEMIDLHHAGAVGFSDGDKPIWHPDILLKSLQYLQPLNSVLISRPFEKYLSIGGQMNEGKVSTLLGLKGIPRLAEELMVERDLQILEYAGGKLHFSLISSPVSLDKIREAKKKGLKVTCDISAHHLFFEDTALTDFDTNLKVSPPLRGRDDVAAFWKALADDTIDAIVSDHNPQDEESKKLEFDLAEFGMTGLETAFAAIHTGNKKLKLEKLLEKITINPRKILNLPVPTVTEGVQANITVADTEKEWTFTEKDIRSKSKNSPFVGKTFKGKAIAVFNKGQSYFNQM